MAHPNHDTMPGTPPSEKPTAPVGRTHVLGLDGLRGLAVLVVVAYHASGSFPGTTAWPLAGGSYGVSVFFVLSGFLVSSALRREVARSGRIDWTGFYLRRAARLLPALAAFAAVHLLYARAAGLDANTERWAMGSAMLGFFNYLWVFHQAATEGSEHLWSLAIEFQFYLVAPVLVATILRPTRPRLAVASLVVAFVGAGLWRAHLYDEGVLWFWLYLRTDTRVDAILAGMLLAYVWRPELVPRTVAGLAGWGGLVYLGGAIAYLALDGPVMHHVGYTLVALATVGVMVSALADTGPTRWLENRMLRGLGRVSYGLYIWHALVFTAVVRWMSPQPVPLQLGVALSVTAAITAASWTWIEQPSMRAAAKWRSSHA